MNKTCCCMGRLYSSIQLKCKNKPTVKNVLFQEIINFSQKFFKANCDPKHGYKTVNKKSRSAVNTRTGTKEYHHVSCFRQDQRPLTYYQPTQHHHTTHNQVYLPRTNLHPFTS